MAFFVCVEAISFCIRLSCLVFIVFQNYINLLKFREGWSTNLHVIILDLCNVGLLSEVGMTTLGLPEEE